MQNKQINYCHGCSKRINRELLCQKCYAKHMLWFDILTDKQKEELGLKIDAFREKENVY